ncbi:MAG: hypothetical protein AABX39_05430 [Nanoarchaeota archaeon]
MGSFFNFAIFLFGIVFFAKKMLGNVLSERSKSIAQDIKSAEEKLKKAEDTLKLWEERSQNLEAERKNIEKSFLEKTERLSSEMKNDLGSYCLRFQQNLDSRIEREQDLMKSSLKLAVSEQALKIALEKVQQNITQKNQSLWFDSFINNIQQETSRNGNVAKENVAKENVAKENFAKENLV